MRIAVIGSGGVGGYFGGMLAKAGNDVSFVARGEHAEALKKNGLIVKSVIGDFEVNPVHVVESIDQLDTPELVLFTVKTYDTESVASELKKVVDNQTIIITFQNGVNNDLIIKSIIPSAQVYPGVCYVISTKTKPGLIEQTGGLRKLIFGDRDNSANAKIREAETVMQKAGIDAIMSDDINRDCWKKFIFITAFSGMTALTRKPIGEVLSNSQTRQQYEDVVRESIRVAQAMGINTPPDIFETTMKTAENTAPESKSSLLHDIENGRKNEIETLNGRLVELARQVGVSVPVNEHIYNEIKKI